MTQYNFFPLMGEPAWKIAVPPAGFNPVRDTWAGWQYDPETGELRGPRASMGALREDYLIGNFPVHGGQSTTGVHRIAFRIMEGRWPHQIDHINRRKADNRWLNLREVSQQRNMHGVKPYAGVYLREHKGRTYWTYHSNGVCYTRAKIQDILQIVDTATLPDFAWQGRPNDPAKDRANG